MIENIATQTLRKLLKALIKAGYDVTIDYERGYDSSGVTEKDGVEAMIEAVQAVDECWIMVGRDGDTYASFVYFIWENEGHAISDYSVSLGDIVDPIADEADRAYCG
jgi:hypothetical protein